MKKSFLLCILICVFQNFFGQVNVNISFDNSIRGKIIQNKFSEFNYFSIDQWNKNEIEKIPDDFFLKNYPSIRRIQLMGAIGGSISRDLFNNPKNNEVLNDYDFNNLIKACKSIVAKGLIPHICLNNVPMKFSKNIKIGGFNVNTSPPDDYNVWYNYIYAIANTLKTTFGLKQIKKWYWQIGIEYENSNWFNAGTPENTKIAFFKLYDYGEAALEDVLGKNNLIVGTHAMVCSKSNWNELSFFDHITKGRNFKTGKIGTRLNFYGISYYDPLPCTMNSLRLLSFINIIRNKMSSVGLKNLSIGINEGGFLNGWDLKPLISGAVEHSMQGPADAKLFKTLVENNIDYWTTWGIGSINNIPLVGFNTINLLYKMVDKHIVNCITSPYNLNNLNDEVDGMAAYDSISKTCVFFVYNNNNDPNEKASETVKIFLKNIVAIPNENVYADKWIIDEDHSSWWKEWNNDSKLNKIANDSLYNNTWSRYSIYPSDNLKNNKDKKIWGINRSKYNELGKLKSTIENINIKNNQLILQLRLSHHSLVFYEIHNITPIDLVNKKID